MMGSRRFWLLIHSLTSLLRMRDLIWASLIILGYQMMLCQRWCSLNPMSPKSTWGCKLMPFQSSPLMSQTPSWTTLAMGAEPLEHHGDSLHRAIATVMKHPTEILDLVAATLDVADALCVDIGASKGVGDATIELRWIQVLEASSYVHTAVTFVCYSCGGGMSSTTVVAYGLEAADIRSLVAPTRRGAEEVNTM